jgi:hypothetical protein
MDSPLTVATASDTGPSPPMPRVPKTKSEPMNAAITTSRPTCRAFRYRRITVIIGASYSSGSRWRRRAAGAPSSGTTRRATVMKPVCATMRWNGRTDWPSMFQGR